MLLGIALHELLPDFSRTVGIEPYWPADDDRATPLYLLYDLIHSWRMAIFFLLAGFFAQMNYPLPTPPASPNRRLPQRLLGSTQAN